MLNQGIVSARHVDSMSTKAIEARLSGARTNCPMATWQFSVDR
jgi:hypothetical protein